MIRDALNFLKSLTLQKIWNLFLVSISYHLSNLLRRPVVWGKPWFISIETVSVCNLSCPQCPVGMGDISRNDKFMKPGPYGRLLDQVAGTTVNLSLYFQGEPLMQKDFPEYVSMATRRGIYTQTSTNGQFLSDEMCRKIVEAGLKRIIISLDGTDQDTYRQYRRGGEFSKVEEGVRQLVRVRNENGKAYPFVIIQFLALKHNQGQEEKIRELAGEWGADRVRIKSAQIEYPGDQENWLPENRISSRYEKSPSGQWKRRGRMHNRCRRLWQTCVITSDSIIVPCCFDKRAEYRMGNPGEESFEAVWKNKNYRDFREMVLSKREDIAICTNCTEGLRRIYR